ncbi:MAG TPA: ATP synthase F1 subunit delta [Vicinamibacterales bacterium]|jgi:F-type H+-transporting ATPase subunit delta
MTNHAAAARYARALLDVSLAESDPQLVEQQLGELVDLFEQSKPLREVLTNPVIAAPKKQGVVRELLLRAPVAPVLQKLLLLLAGRDRLSMLPDLRRAFHERVLEYRQVVQVEVTTAIPLPADRARALTERLRAVAGRDVLLSAHTDPSIIGGVVARIGSTVYDGSVARQLQKMKETLGAGL